MRVSGFPAPIPFLADADLSYHLPDGTPVIECHPVSVAQASQSVWRVARILVGYLRYLRSLPPP